MNNALKIMAEAIPAAMRATTMLGSAEQVMEFYVEIARLNACIEQRHATLAGEMMASVAKEVAVAGAIAGSVGDDIRSAALEEAAKACEQRYTGLGGPIDDPHPDAILVNGTVNDCAAAIRALAPDKVQGAATESQLRDAVTILRGALVSAEYAIKGREHTGFITKALVATEFATSLAGAAVPPIPAPIEAPAKLTDEQMREAVAEGLRGLYGCGRVWSAWSVGTMGEDDFYPAEESDECITQVVDAIESALTAQPGEKA